jgi:hypothetical protein
MGVTSGAGTAFRIRKMRSIGCLKGEFEDTKGAIRIRISKKNKQNNGQKKKHKRTHNDLQNIHIDHKIGSGCFSAKHAALRRKNKDWLARKHDNMSE